MFMPMLERLEAAVKDKEQIQIRSLFDSETSFWMTAAAATSFSLQSYLEATDEPSQREETEAMLQTFNQCLRAGEVEEEVVLKSKEKTLANLDAICAHEKKICAFNLETSLPVCFSFTSYWLLTKLIEVEWQKLLDEETVLSTYQFLDGVIYDRGELNIIRESMAKGALEDDEMVYIRTHWKQARLFFNRLYNEMQLLAAGVIPFESIRRR